MSRGSTWTGGLAIVSLGLRIVQDSLQPTSTSHKWSALFAGCGLWTRDVSSDLAKMLNVKLMHLKPRKGKGVDDSIWALQRRV